MKNLIFILLILVSLIGCKKEEKNTSFVLTGKLLKDCSGEPLANFPLKAIVKTKRIVKATDVYYFDTDVNGNINLLIEEIGLVELRAAAGATLLSDIPGPGNKKELNLGTFMASPTTSFVYRIKVNNPYNVGDTLYANLRSTFTLSHIVIPAPLKDTLFTIKNFFDQNRYPISDKIEVKVGYGVAHDNPNIMSNWYIDETYNYSSPICNTLIDTVTITVN